MGILRKIIGYSIVLFSLLYITGLLAEKSVQAEPPASFRSTSVVTDGIINPTSLAFAADGSLFIAERGGAVKIYKDGALLPDPFIQLPAWEEGDRGLLGIALDPDFSHNHYVYLHYVNTDTFIYLIRVREENNRAAGEPTILYSTTVPTDWMHTAGALAFGPDGKLYAGLGDNNEAPNAQNLANPFGKILRFNPDGSIPGDNPFANDAAKHPAIWAYGLRNPWRLQFDRENGRLYVSDVGGDIWEELNDIGKGANYGWPLVEGACNDCPYANPLYAYPHDGEGAAITIGPVYRAEQFPLEYSGKIFIGDFVRGIIKTVTPDGASADIFDNAVGSIVDMKVGPDGALYYVTFYPPAVYRIAYERGNRAPVVVSSADITSGAVPLTVRFSSNGTHDSDDDALMYHWDFGDGTMSNEPNPVKMYETMGENNAALSVSDGTTTVSSVPITIKVGTPPTVHIEEPLQGATYRPGDTVTYRISAVESNGNEIPDEQVVVDVLFHHNTHTHPFLTNVAGKQGSFTIPSDGESSADTWYQIIATVRDSNGLSNQHAIELYPRTATPPEEINVNLEPNTYFQVPANALVDGYIEICESENGPCMPHWNPDDNGDFRGIMTKFNQSTWIKSPWGIFITSTMTVDELESAMRDHGCLGGCQEVANRSYGSTTEPDPTPTEVNVNLSPNTYYRVPSGALIDGYIEICSSATGPCTPHWAVDDNGEFRGILTKFLSSVWIRSPWGVFITNVMSEDELEAAMRDHGCVGGCTEVAKRIWP